MTPHQTKDPAKDPAKDQRNETGITDPKKIACAERFTPTAMLPKVELSGMSVIVNGQRLSLSRKARAYRVIRAFFANAKPALSAEELLAVLNREEGLPLARSPRAKQSQHGALVRLFSRMREEFEETFRTKTPSGTTWFHYDRLKNHWVLFKMPSTGADGLTY
jgi:hypothetical protein